jgi:cytosine/adenosine deaminase-related metal-dependent hydrolase
MRGRRGASISRWFSIRAARGCLSAGLLVLLALASPGAGRTQLQQVGARNDRWAWFATEGKVDALLDRLSREARPESFAITHVSLLAMTSPGLVADQTVVVAGGRIVAVGPARSTPVPANATVVDGRGKVLMPGLVDMHVHTLVSSSQLLLLLAQGVTGARDMDGFPWTLRVRDRIAGGKLLAPDLYVAGTILNYFPMSWYARVVRTEEQARTAVREQKAAGYDFIKVHNSMPLPVYTAILDEARKQGIDVVGHIPHEVLVAQAVALGQRTLEHLKGFYLDTNLTESTEDYVTPMRAATSTWICPTLTAARGSLRGEAALRTFEDPAVRPYVSWLERRRWRDLANLPAEPLQQNVLPLSRAILKKLLPVHPRLLAGTDSGGGYPFAVAGVVLHDELDELVGVGLSPYEALRAATVEPAAAMRREAELGTVEVGKRADLLLLDANPLEAVGNARKVAGVAVRGRWLSRQALDGALAGLTALYDPPSQPDAIPPPTPAEVDAVVRNLRELHAGGYVFRDHDLGELAQLLDYLGRHGDATAVLALRTDQSVPEEE